MQVRYVRLPDRTFPLRIVALILIVTELRLVPRRSMSAVSRLRPLTRRLATLTFLPATVTVALRTGLLRWETIRMRNRRRLMHDAAGSRSDGAETFTTAGVAGCSLTVMPWRTQAGSRVPVHVSLMVTSLGSA